MRNLALAGLGFVLATAVMLLILREPTEPLTADGLRDARRRWHASGIGDYTLHYRMHGSTYEVTVRDGIVVGANVDGQPPRGSELGAYGVEGLLETLELELENLANPAGPFAGRRDTIIMRVRFHPKQGYIERYLRSSGGYGPGVSIELIEFAARP